MEDKAHKYLMFKIEGKNIPVDLEYLKSQDFILQLGYMDKERKVFTSEKSISLEDLEKGGFKLD